MPLPADILKDPDNKSATIDDWKPEWIETLRAIGNRRAKEYYEANVPEGERFQGPVDLVGGDKMDEKEGRKLKKWIRAKYEDKKYAPKGVEDPYKRLAKGEKLDGGGGGGKKKKDKKEKAAPVVEEAPKGKKEKKSKKKDKEEDDDGGAEQWDQSWQEQQGWEGDAAWDQSNAWQQSAGGNEGWGAGGEEAWGAEAWNGGAESWSGGAAAGGGAAWGAEGQYPGAPGYGGYDAGAAGGYGGPGYDGSPAAAAAGGYGCGAGYDGSPAAAAAGGYGCGAGYDGSPAGGYAGSGYDTAGPAAGGYGGYDASSAAAGGYCPSPAGNQIMANGGGTSFQMSSQEAAYERSQALQSISKLFLDPSFLGVPPHVQLIRPFGFDLHTSSIDKAALRKHKAGGASFNSTAMLAPMAGMQGAANGGYPGGPPTLPPYYPTG